MRSPERNSALPLTADRAARLVALFVPAGLLGGAYVAEYGFGLYPCEMCWWQRYPHFIALALALLAFAAPPVRVWTALAAGSILASAAIGGYHAGIEYDWWQGVTNCTRIVPSDPGSSPLESIMNTPMISCDEAQWRFAGVSLAGFNFLFSLAGGLAVFALLLGRRRS